MPPPKAAVRYCTESPCRRRRSVEKINFVDFCTKFRRHCVAISLKIRRNVVEISSNFRRNSVDFSTNFDRNFVESSSKILRHFVELRRNFVEMSSKIRRKFDDISLNSTKLRRNVDDFFDEFCHLLCIDIKYCAYLDFLYSKFFIPQIFSRVFFGFSLFVLDEVVFSSIRDRSSEFLR